MAALAKREPRLKWEPEEDEVILKEWHAALRPSGQARQGLLDHLAALLPHRTPAGIRNHMVRLVRRGRIPRQRERSRYTPLQLTEAQKGWLAGILDGEGSVKKVTRLTRYGHMLNGYSIQVVICYNTDPGIIERARALVPHAQLHSRTNNGHGRKTVHQLQLSGFTPLKDYLCAVLPYVAHAGKRVRIEQILDHIERRQH